MVIVQHDNGHSGAWSKDISLRLLNFAIALEAGTERASREQCLQSIAAQGSPFSQAPTFPLGSNPTITHQAMAFF